MSNCVCVRERKNERERKGGVGGREKEREARVSFWESACTLKKPSALTLPLSISRPAPPNVALSLLRRAT